MKKHFALPNWQKITHCTHLFFLYPSNFMREGALFVCQLSKHHCFSMKHFLNVLRRLPLLFTNYFIQLVPLQPMPWPQWCYVFVFSIHLYVCACRDILQLACHRLLLYFIFLLLLKVPFTTLLLFIGQGHLVQKLFSYLQRFSC